MTFPSELPWDWIRKAGWPGCYFRDGHYYSPDEPRPADCEYMRFDDPAIVELTAPIHNDGAPLWAQVIADARECGLPETTINSMRARMELGRAKHGTYLQGDNGRDMIVDMTQELLDAAVYAKGATLEDQRWEIHATYMDLLRLLEALYKHNIVGGTAAP